MEWNVLHRVLFRQKCHYVYHFSLTLSLLASCYLRFARSLTHSSLFLTVRVLTKNEGVVHKAKGAKHTYKEGIENAKEVFVDVIYFRRRRQWFQVLFYIPKL
jgi:hypothetical protein